MKQYIRIVVSLLCVVASVLSAEFPSFTPEQRAKIGSGMLLIDAEKKNEQARATPAVSAEARMLTVAIYAAHEPTFAESAELDRLGVRAYPASWIPPLEHHPLGFFIARVPVERIGDVLSLASVKKMDSAEEEALPMNNSAAAAVNATLAWAAGYTGTGVKIGVIDSGLNTRLAGTELPAGLQVRNYAFYPSAPDTNVHNTVTGHGTHVTGTVLGRARYSTWPVLNTGNGGGAYTGMAPDAGLVFLKIGQTSTSGATTTAMIAALKAAVDSFHVDVINMSYGGWDAYHDGSSESDQAADYVFSQGVPCFFSAGNEAARGRHYSGTAEANSVTDYIKVTASVWGYLNFNLVWSDGADHKNLRLIYYDAAHTELTDVTTYTTTESPRGTESVYSRYMLSIPPGTYYLRVRNPSSSPQFFHIYENRSDNVVKFADADPHYTLTHPATADHAMAVAAYSFRSSWIDYAGTTQPNTRPLNDVTEYSSRGPRVDEYQKPDIAAPGSVTISIRDRDVYSGSSTYCVDSDGTIPGGSADYYVMEGTSMASPAAAGCAALMFQHTPGATPQQVYDAIRTSALVDSYTGSVPNSTWGYGKLDVNAALQSPALPVELASFTSEVQNGAVLLSWRTATETNNHGFEIERKMGAMASSSWAKIGFVPGAGTTSAPHAYSYTDKFAHPGLNAYRLKQIDRDGSAEYSSIVEAAIEGGPVEYALAQNYPNPFNPSTTLQFSIARKGHVRLLVYDLLGRVHAVLVDREMEPGSYAAEWKADGASSGVYLCRLESGGFTSVKKLILQK